MYKRRTEFLREALAATGLALAVPGLANAEPAIGKPEKTALKVGLPVPATSFLPIYLAAARTWKEQGLDVQLFTFRGDAEAAQALAGGSTDINIQSTSALINLINNNNAVSGFYAGCYQADINMISAPAVKKWADLKGKLVGVATFGSITDALTRYMLRKNGLQPEKDVQLVNVGGSPSAFQALKNGSIAASLMSSPFKWQGIDDGLNVLGTQAKDVSPQWPKHVFIARNAVLNDYPNTIYAFLRAHVRAIRLAKADRELSVQVMIDQLKYSRQWSERAYDDVIGGYNERGTLPDKYMHVFWEIAMANGDVKEPWPDSKLLNPKYIDSFKRWAPTN